LHEKCFELDTSFSRVETGSIGKIYISFRFVAASRKKSFHISAVSHNAQVKLRNLYLFAEAFKRIEAARYSAHLSHSIILQ